MNIIKNSKIRQEKLWSVFSAHIESNSRTLCFRELISTTSFKSTKTKSEFYIFQTMNCKSKWIIYLLECHLCKIWYDVKSEKPPSIGLNNHGKDVFLWRRPLSYRNQSIDLQSTASVMKELKARAWLRHISISLYQATISNSTLFFLTINKQNKRTNRDN